MSTCHALRLMKNTAIWRLSNGSKPRPRSKRPKIVVVSRWRQSVKSAALSDLRRYRSAVA